MPCTCAVMVPHNGTVLGGYADGSLRLLSIRDVGVVWTSERHTGSGVVSVQLHPRRPLAISAGRCGEAQSSKVSVGLGSYMRKIEMAGG